MHAIQFQKITLGNFFPLIDAVDGPAPSLSFALKVQIAKSHSLNDPGESLTLSVCFSFWR